MPVRATRINTVTIDVGAPYPLGATVQAGGVNFSASEARRVSTEMGHKD